MRCVHKFAHLDSAIVNGFTAQRLMPKIRRAALPAANQRVDS
jgi:hypothetical protein